jgi:hypothetical protein
MRFWFGASGAKKLCALGALGRSQPAPHFTVSRQPGACREV